MSQVLERPTLAAKTAAPRHEYAEQDAIEPRLQVGPRFVLALEAKGSFEGVLHEVARELFAAREAQRTSMKIGKA
jgi:hypothetical protein